MKSRWIKNLLELPTKSHDPSLMPFGRFCIFLSKKLGVVGEIIAFILLWVMRLSFFGLIIYLVYLEVDFLLACVISFIYLMLSAGFFMGFNPEWHKK